ncbi:MAG TPA: DUF433 domain-containing protein [Armatimonadota bacterium]|nr:DUF433 domain-containing protein [Armatimonadota bacterium]
MMQLEEYFDFAAPDDIRIRGHRIGIETVLDSYLHRGQTPEQIQETYPTLSLDEVYATILYYLRNREDVGRYIAAWIDYCHRATAEAESSPPPDLQRLRAVQEELAGYPPEERRTVMRAVVARHKAHWQWEQSEQEKDGEPRLTTAEKSELDRRLAYLNANPEAVVTWDAVQAQVRRRSF